MNFNKLTIVNKYICTYCCTFRFVVYLCPMKQTQTTPFLKLARRIDKEINSLWGICPYIMGHNEKWFREMFIPTQTERKEYNMLGLFWLSSYYLDRKENNQFRILILLLAHEVWVDEMKGKIKLK